jgi:hypothetical protein
MLHPNKTAWASESSDLTGGGTEPVVAGATCGGCVTWCVRFWAFQRVSETVTVSGVLERSPHMISSSSSPVVVCEECEEAKKLTTIIGIIE